MSENSLTIKATIEVQGSPRDVADWLSRLPRDDSVSGPPQAEWDAELAYGLVKRISPTARQALYHMARHAPTLSFDELQDELKLEGLAIGGVLASVGFAVRAGYPRPYVVDRALRRYVMEPEVAELILEALGRIES